MKRIVLCFLTLLVCIGLQAQVRQISGVVVYGNDGEPLAGATVELKNRAWAVVTDVDGKFSIEVPDGNHKLQVRFPGMQTRTIGLPRGGGDVELVVRMVREERKLTPFVQAGVTLSRPKGEGTDGPGVGFTVGGGVSYALTHLFSLAASVNILQKPSEWKGASAGASYTCEVNPLYLNIPVLLEMKFWDRNNRNKFLVNLGPYIGIGLGGEYRYEGILPDESEGPRELKGGLFEGDDADETALHRVEAGLQLGVGYVWNHCYLGLNCQYAFTPLLNDRFGTVLVPTDGVRNFCADISLGYRF